MSYIENLEKQLFEMQDLKYRDFHSKLLPGIDRETIIGIQVYKRICRDTGSRTFSEGSATPIL